MNTFYENCIKAQEYASCSSQTLRKEGIDEASVQQCVSSSFEVTMPTARVLQKNSLLEEQRRLKATTGVRYYPGAVINSQAYMGNINVRDIMGEICYSLYHPPKACRNYVDNFDGQFDDVNPKFASKETNVAAIVIFVLILMVLFFLFMVFIYRRMVRREISRDMSNQVNQMVTQYISFYESKDKEKQASPTPSG
jgi:hypothetical protein